MLRAGAGTAVRSSAGEVVGVEGAASRLSKEAAMSADMVLASLLVRGVGWGEGRECCDLCKGSRVVGDKEVLVGLIDELWRCWRYGSG